MLSTYLEQKESRVPPLQGGIGWLRARCVRQRGGTALEATVTVTIIT